MTFSKVLVRIWFFLHIAKISLILYEFYFEDIAKISQIVGPLGHTIIIKKMAFSKNYLYFLMATSLKKILNLGVLMQLKKFAEIPRDP